MTRVGRIDTDRADFFDWWREQYDTLTPEENIEIGDQLEAKYPGQASFNFKNLQSVFKQRHQLTVLEIGGWKGELAKACFETWGTETILSWHNIDMCEAAVKKTIPMGEFPYSARFPYEFDWFAKEQRKQKYDVCISAHTIEHLSDQHLVQLISYISGIPIVMFEAPIAMDGQKWDGYFGTHKLEMGWNTINKLMEGEGYEVEKLNDWSFIYKLRQ